ncbi:MAG: dTMP kinase [Candidatus Marinimicrobia bacterium]|nr:dTMP kinase [Candidatus Neomarinimicrobiota bacterium]
MFITFEGIEGSGKTSQIEPVAKYLKERGFDCVITHEPGGTEICKKIRQILLDSKNTNLCSKAELLLYMADRAQHIHEVIEPKLKEGKIVLCDRYFDATVSYQGFARGMGIGFVANLHKMILDDLRPDITFLFDLPVEIGLKRARGDIQKGKRGKEDSRFENEKMQFHEKVRQGYLIIAKWQFPRFEMIDASKTEMMVFHQIIKILDERI